MRDEVWRGGGSEASVKGEGLVSGIDADARFGVFPDAFLEEVGLALEGYEFHPVEGVGAVEQLAVSEGLEEAISDKFDVLSHEVRVHANEVTGEGIADEFAFNFDGASDDFMNELLGESVLEHRVEETSEIGMQSFVP